MPNITRRFIGHLQTNKVNKCLELFDTIDSVDSFKLAEKINNRSSFLNKKTSILLEINTSGDESKKGFPPSLDDDFYSIFGLDSLKVDGLMTMGPLSQKEDETRSAFALLRKIKTLWNLKQLLLTLMCQKSQSLVRPCDHSPVSPRPCLKL